MNKFSNNMERTEAFQKLEARKKVQNLYDWEEDNVEASESKFYMEAFQNDQPEKIECPNLKIVENLSVESIINFLNESCSAIDLKVYSSSSVPIPNQNAQIVLSLPNSAVRRSLMFSILKSFKHIFPKRFIPIDGDTDKSAEWIVMNLTAATVHIMDPQYRKYVDLDGKFDDESCPRLDDEVPQFLDKFAKNPPRSISRKPNFIEKFMKNKE